MTANRRTLALAAAALACGIAIGWNDSRPNWIDTGVTAGLLVGIAALFGVIDPRRWWLWALLVGVGAPLFEITGETGTASLAAFAFTAVGAAGGARGSRLLRSDRPQRPRDRLEAADAGPRDEDETEDDSGR
jgi:hypothetical protein